MKLADIEALTPEQIAALPLGRIKSLMVEVQTVDCLQEPNEAELAEIIDRVRVVFQALHNEHLTRTMRACGGPPEPYVSVRLPSSPGER